MIPALQVGDLIAYLIVVSANSRIIPCLALTLITLSVAGSLSIVSWDGEQGPNINTARNNQKQKKSTV